MALSGRFRAVGTNETDCLAPDDPGPDDPNPDTCGGVYLFSHDGSVVQHAERIAPGDQATSIGSAIAIDGRTLLAADSRTQTVWVYKNIGTAWLLHSKITAPDLHPGESFGESISVDGDQVIIGNSRDACGPFANCGSAYVYQLTSADHQLQTQLRASDAAMENYFARSVSIENDVIVAGATGANCALFVPDCGKAYAYHFVDGRWIEQRLPTPDPGIFGNVGSSVSIGNGIALIGAQGGHAPVGSAMARGKAFAFPLSPNGDCNCNGMADACEEDCNRTHQPDECDILIGSSIDCNANSIPDECETDCNQNGIDDACDIADATSSDCDGSGIPDECELHGRDCNHNRILDSCDLENGTSADCNGTSFPDECELEGNDCNATGIPDECEFIEDCNANCSLDIEDIASGFSKDCNGNSRPDECEIPVGTDVTGGPFYCEFDCIDCNGSGIPDDCELESNDCNNNGNPDECDIHRDTSTSDNEYYCQFDCAVDCDNNAVPDACEMNARDCNGDGRLDECGTPAACEVSELFTIAPRHRDDRDEFGWTIAIEGNLAAVAATGDDCCGVVHLYERSRKGWTKTAELPNPAQTLTTTYGDALAIVGGRVIVADDLLSCDDGEFCGGVYVFAMHGSRWALEATLTAEAAQAGDRFGYSLAARDDEIYVGAPRTYGRGVVYGFTRDGLTWRQRIKIDPKLIDEAQSGEADVRGAEFGHAIACGSEGLLVGAPGMNEPSCEECGRAFLYQPDDGKLLQSLSHYTLQEGDRFGSDVTIDRDRLAVSRLNPTVGSVFLFQLYQGTWFWTHEFSSPTGRLGSSVELHNTVLLAGAMSESCGQSSVNCGAVHLFPIRW